MSTEAHPTTPVPDEHDEKKAAKWGTFWWTLSVLFHFVVVGSVVYFTPLREYVFGKKEGGIGANINEDQIGSIAAAMIKAVEERMREDIGTLRNRYGLLDPMRTRRYAKYLEEFRVYGKSEGLKEKPLSALGATGPAMEGDPVTLDMFALYDYAQKVELNCIGAYRHIKVMELARIQRIDLEEASEATKLATPEHAPINKAIFYEKIESLRDGRMALLKAELNKVRVEVADMVSNIQRMMDMANGIEGGTLVGTLVLGSATLNVQGAGMLKWGASAGPPLTPLELFPASDGNLPANFRPPAGRKLMSGGLVSDWMALDTWYIIGPFPNPKREYMDKKFPPESVIDLDAVYVGKENRKLQWEWTQTKDYWPMAPRIADAYAIWYGYTEVWSQKDQARVCLFGSDDYSKVWVNGELIYTSGKDPHHWIPDRGYQKVFFKKGFNSILLKLENGGGTTGFSMCIFLGETGG